MQNGYVGGVGDFGRQQPDPYGRSLRLPRVEFLLAMKSEPGVMSAVHLRARSASLVGVRIHRLKADRFGHARLPYS